MNTPYFGFIFAAYAIGFTVIAVMIVATLLDYRSLNASSRNSRPARAAP